MSFNSMNKVFLLGTLGKDPEIRYSNSGKAIANFSVATSESLKNQSGEYEEKTTWHNIVSFRHAENCGKYLKKGSKCMIEGKIQNRNYTDKNGNERYISEVIADFVRFLDPKNRAENKQENPKQDNYDFKDIDDDDDMPF